ncbi:O-antigen ligase family protein [Sphingomonas kyeonggiensis]|uniref:O-antigen ligase n=1 Tax=Sphingomonas kyeonggiensis TaxID=1268553 RepID=A0A7W6NYM0_9SPHN|nr:O-antigen ligase family protein [Sphingomonas kyeonggiensis]MBB4099921.1 O-antigen ligase [Sphingomonas kyeonggiensis]
MARISSLPWNVWIALSFWLVLLFFGGASRGDEPAQVAVRVAAVVLLAALWSARHEARPELKPLFWLLLSIATLIGMQLVPLPPGLWTALPGREPYAALAGALGVEQPWRPINLAPSLGWNALVALLPCFAVLMAIVSIGRKRLSLTLAAICIAAVVSALLGVAQLGEGETPLFRAYRIFTASQPSGIFANRNHQALLLALAIPCLAVWGVGREKTRAMVALGAALLLVVALLATGSRAGLLLLVPSLAASAYFSRSLFAKGRARRWAIIAVVALAAAVIGAMIAADRSASLQRLFTADAVADKRSANFAALVEMAKAFFPFGSGFGSFEPVFRRFEPFQTLTFTYFNQAHNDPLQVVIEGGLPGVLIVLAYLVFWTRHSLRAWFRPAPANSLAQLGSVVTALCMGASVVDYPLRTPLIACVFLVASAWLASGAAAGTGAGPARPSRSA